MPSLRSTMPVPAHACRCCGRPMDLLSKTTGTADPHHEPGERGFYWRCQAPDHRVCGHRAWTRATRAEWEAADVPVR